MWEGAWGVEFWISRTRFFLRFCKTKHNEIQLVVKFRVSLDNGGGDDDTGCFRIKQKTNAANSDGQKLTKKLLTNSLTTFLS